MASLLLLGILLSMLPFGELRVAIPIMISNGIDPLLAFLVSTSANIIIIPAIFLFLDFAHGGLKRFKFYRKSFDFALRRVRKSEKKLKTHIEKYGLWALVLFTAIPLPATGAYTAALLVWILGIKKEKAAGFIAAGILIAGILVTLASVGALKLFSVS